ncbi:MAG: hypothetical protein V3R83_12435 [Gammaproteobacteria bacterium]
MTNNFHPINFSKFFENRASAWGCTVQEAKDRLESEDGEERSQKRQHPNHRDGVVNAHFVYQG